GNLDVATTTFSIVANMSFGGVMLGDGAGHFSFSGAGGGFFGAGPVSPTLGDVDGDGKCDLIVTSPVAGTVAVKLSNGAGGFGPDILFTAGTKPAFPLLAHL